MVAGAVTLGGSVGTKVIDITGDRDSVSFSTDPSITIQGRWAAATLTSGAQYGSAGAGTTATSLIKPGAAANWTAHDLIGKFVKITSGAASGSVRPVIDNTTTAATIHGATGLAAGDDFEIVVPAYTITNLSATRINHSLVVQNLIIGNLTTFGNGKVYVVNCLFNVSGGSVQSSADTAVEISECMFDGTSLSITDAKYAYATNLVVSDGWCYIAKCNNVLVGMYADSCTSTALYLKGCLHARVGLEAQGCTATPCHMESCNYVEPNGVGFIGTNAGATYGILFEKSGYYDVTSGTLAGAADLRIEDQTCTWAQLGTYKCITRKGVAIMTTA